MKLTKERKVYAAVLGLGLSVLAGDRLFFGGAAMGPGSASAAGPGAPAAAPPAVHDAPGEKSPAGAPVPTLAARLEGIRPEVVRNRTPADILSVSSPLHPEPRSLLHDRGHCAGLFTTKARWLAPKVSVAAAAPEKPKETLKDVLARHKINTVVLAGPNGKDSFILVDDNLREQLQAGDVFDGIRIVAITKGKASTPSMKGTPSTVTLGYGSELLEIEFEKFGGDR
jgi:hypothetical protein